MRREFARWITEKAKQDKDIYLIVGDIGYKIFDKFKQEYSDRFINVGLCEQSMIGMAAGMALSGLKPYIYTITPFLIERPFEQIKVDIDLNNVNVKLVGYADYPTQGKTHNEINGRLWSEFWENILSYFPRNSEATRHILDMTYNLEDPVFISLKEDK